MDFEFTFTDAFTFGDAMNRAPAIVQREMTAAVTRLALTGEREAKAVVPVRTGHLRRSITATKGMWSGTGASATYGTNTTYAPYVEYGTSRMAAQPYMGPSMEAVSRQMPPEMEAALQRILASMGVG